MGKNDGRIKEMRKLLPAPAVFLLIFLFIPVLGFIFHGGNLAAFISKLINYITDSYYQKIIGFTFLQSIVSTLFALLLGLPGAYIMSHYSFKGKKLFQAAAMVPFVLPSILVVLGFIIFFGRNGAVNAVWAAMGGEKPIPFLYNFWAIIMAHSFYNFPLTLKLVGDRWSQLPQSRIEAAKTLGASNWKITRSIILPHLKPALLSAALLTFMYCFMSFAVLLVLGGGPQFSTIEVEMYRNVKITLDYDAARALAFIQTIIGLGLLFLYNRYEKSLEGRESKGIIVKKLTRAKGITQLFSGLYAMLMAVLVAGPVLSIIVSGFLKRASRTGGFAFSLEWYQQLFFPGNHGLSSGLPAIITSLILGLAAALISLILSAIIAGGKGRLSRLLKKAVLLPLGISTIVLSAGYILIFKNANIPYILLIASHSLISLPILSRSLELGYRNISPHLYEAASTLGAGQWRTLLTLEIPMLLPVIVSSLGFAFAFSLGDLNTSIMLAPRNLETMPLAMYRMIDAYKFNYACAMGTVMTTTAILGFLFFHQLGGLYARLVKGHLLKKK